LSAIPLIWLAGTALAACPAGSYPALDNWGNQICKAFGGNTVTVAPGSSGGCPNGSYPTLDSRGNQMCQEFGRGGRTYYETSKGCPSGSYPSLDSWGNPVCR
jgi:hypothetical protein